MPKRKKDEKYVVHYGLRIRRRTWKTGTGETREAFVLLAGLDATGKHVRLQFPTMEAAKAEAQRKSTALRRDGLAAHQLSEDQRRDAVAAINRLKGAGISLLEAADYYLMAHPVRDDSMPLGALVDRFLEDAAKGRHKPKGTKIRPLAPRTLKAYRLTCGWLVGELGSDCPVGTITTETVETAIAIKGVGPDRQQGLKRDLGVLFAYAEREGHRTGNPIPGVTVEHADRDLPAIWTPAMVKKVMETAAKECPRYAPGLAISFFAGVRPDGELRRLTWDSVDLEGERIIIPVSVSKNTARAIPITANLRAWLEAYMPADAAGPVFPGSEYALRMDRRRIMDALGEERWPHDVTRHCYGSYLVAETEDVYRVMRNMGHTSTRMLERHYDGLATKAAAKKYFAIRPKRRPAGELVRIA